MDPSSEFQGSPSDMLISPRWGLLLSILLLVNLSLVAWAAAFVPEEWPTAGPSAASPPAPATAPPVASHPPAPLVAHTEAVVPAVEGPNSPPRAAEIAATSAEPAPIASIQAEWAPEPQSESSDTELSESGPSHLEPRESASPAAPRAQLPKAPVGLVVINPPSTGGAVHFLLEDEVITLGPGEFHLVVETAERVVKFDRGEDFGVVEQKVSDEVWTFAVGPRGWHFQQVERDQAGRHLQGCRPRRSSGDRPATDS